MNNQRLPRLRGACNKCGFIFDLYFGLDCPACRTLAVQEAFKPVDSLRTALGIGLQPDAELEGVWHWHGERYRPAPEKTEEDMAEIAWLNQNIWNGEN
jgi:hypothetical protein